MPETTVARLASIDYAIMAVYFVAVLGVGWGLRRLTRTTTDFFLSGRSLPPWITGLAFISANLGAQEVIGMGASGAKYGIATSHFYWVGAIPAMVFVGLFVPGLGPVAANDAYADPAVWQRWRRDRYHSPYVVWGREVNLLLLGLAQKLAAARAAGVTPDPVLRAALDQTRAAVDASGMGHNELWSYRIERGRLLPIRYGTGSDVQLWNTTDLAVQYALSRLPPR